MKAVQSISLFVFLLLGMTACEKEIQFKGELTTPYLVAGSFATPDSVFKIHISKSRFFLDNNDEMKNLNDAVVHLWVNGTDNGKMNLIGGGMYVSSYTPKVNDSVYVSISQSVFGNVSAGTRIPKAPSLAVDTTMGYEKPKDNYYGEHTVSEDLVKTVRFKIHISDAANERNYYRITLKEETTQNMAGATNSWTRYINDIQDVILGNVNDMGPSGRGENRYLVFSDEMIDGKTYTLTHAVYLHNYNPANSEYYSQEIKYTVTLQQISKDYYLYLKTFSQANADDMFTEPAQIYTNIKGGIGILGSYTSTSKEFVVK